MNLSLAVLLVLLGRGQTNAETVVINEFLANNVNTLAAEDGGYHDWIELFNSSESPVDLDGWLRPAKTKEIGSFCTFPAFTSRDGCLPSLRLR